MSHGHNGGPPLDGGIGSDGWIAIARRMRTHWLVGFGIPVEPYDPSRGAYSRAEAWLDLIMECRYAAGTVINGGRRMELRAGQLVGATSWLATRWNWSPKTTRLFLDRLEMDGMIERFSPGTTPSSDETRPYTTRGQQKGKQASVITICNYDIYQVTDATQGQATGHEKGEQWASKGQARGNIYKEETKEQGKQGNKIDSPSGIPAHAAVPPAPQPEAPSDLLAKLGLDEGRLAAIKQIADPARLEAFERFERQEAQKRLRAEAKAAEVAKRRDLANEALSLYNKAAAHFGFSLCESFTEKRADALLRRLDDIGGLENFRLALRAIGRDEFLSGRVNKPGQKPFRLDFDRLLSTGSGLGDVLARLLDLAHRAEKPEDKSSPNGKAWGWWRPEIEKIKILPADYWRRRLDALKPNGTWPWWELGPPPGHAEALVDWDAVSGSALSEVYNGEVEHA